MAGQIGYNVIRTYQKTHVYTVLRSLNLPFLVRFYPYF